MVPVSVLLVIIVLLTLKNLLKHHQVDIQAHLEQLRLRFASQAHMLINTDQQNASNALMDLSARSKKHVYLQYAQSECSDLLFRVTCV